MFECLEQLVILLIVMSLRVVFELSNLRTQKIYSCTIQCIIERKRKTAITSLQCNFPTVSDKPIINRIADKKKKQ